MAGSYFAARDGWSLIENMGDAYEAVEELLWLVESQIGYPKAGQILNNTYYPMVRKEIPEDEAIKKIRKMMAG